MPTKSWFESKSVWAQIVAGLAFALRLGGIDISSDSPQIVDGILNVLSFGGLIVGIYGRIRASKLIAPKTAGSPAGLDVIIACALLPAVLLTSCATLQNVAQSPASLRSGTALACNGLLMFGVKDADRAVVAANLYSISSAVYSLSGSDAPDPAVLQETLQKWLPNGSKYYGVISTVVQLYRGYYPRIKGNPKAALDALNAIALGVNDAAIGYLPLGS